MNINVNTNQTKKELLNIISQLKKIEIYNMIQNYNQQNLKKNKINRRKNTRR